MKQVRIYHPALDRYVEVPETAVPIHRESGWIPADERTVEIQDKDGGWTDVTDQLAVAPAEQAPAETPKASATKPRATAAAKETKE